MTGAVGAAGGLPAAGAASASRAPGTPGDGDAAKAAEGFERMLLGQLTRTLVDSALAPDASTSAASSAYRDMLPDALTDSLMRAGGIGIAAALRPALGGEAT